MSKQIRLNSSTGNAAGRLNALIPGSAGRPAGTARHDNAWESRPRYRFCLGRSREDTRPYETDRNDYELKRKPVGLHAWLRVCRTPSLSERCGRICRDVLDVDERSSRVGLCCGARLGRNCVSLVRDTQSWLATRL